MRSTGEDRPVRRLSDSGISPFQKVVVNARHDWKRRTQCQRGWQRWEIRTLAALHRLSYVRPDGRRGRPGQGLSAACHTRLPESLLEPISKLNCELFLVRERHVTPVAAPRTGIAQPSGTVWRGSREVSLGGFSGLSDDGHRRCRTPRAYQLRARFSGHVSLSEQERGTARGTHRFRGTSVERF